MRSLLAAVILASAAASDAGGLLEVHLETSASAPDARAWVLRGKGGSTETVLLDSSVLLDQTVVASADSVVGPGGSPEIRLVLTPEGARKLQEVTARSVGKRLGIAVNGRLRAAPVIVAAVTNGVLLLAGDFTFAESSSLAPQLGPPAPKSPEGEPLAALAWMAGEWEGNDRGVWNEERWTEPAGGMMLAVHRDISGGKATSFEFLRIESTPDGIVYFASPRGKAATPFRLVESAPRRVVFENKELEFPHRILYWMEREGEMRARIEGTRNGKPLSEEWTWKRRTRR